MLNTINIAKCIQEAHHIGYTKFYNICTTGDFHSVPWGALDWVGFATGVSFAAFGAALITSVGCLIYRDCRYG